MKFHIFALAALLGVITVSGSAEEDWVSFDYQGLVKVQGNAYTGAGQFKFSILNTSGTATLWTNDGTGLNGTEPTSSVSLSVANGVFDVMIGDPATTGMQTINSSILNSPTPRKLRTWFSDGVHGFQQLNPDSNLANIAIVTLRTGTHDFTVYVNGATGDDGNNGLSPGTAKKTIQGAVNSLPERMRCNVTIDIADGIYREEVDLSGLFVTRGNSLTLLGDEIWTPASGSPAVRITGTDNDGTHVRVRPYCIFAEACSGIVLRGLLLDYATSAGFWCENGSYKVLNCQAANNAGFCGLFGFKGAAVDFTNCDSRQNAQHGFASNANSRSYVTSCSAVSNGGCGFQFFSQTTVNIQSPILAIGNGQHGIQVSGFTNAGFQYPGMVATLKNNGLYGLSCTNTSEVDYYSINPGIVNSGNASGATQSTTGGVIY